MYQHIVMAHAHLLTAPMAPEPGGTASPNGLPGMDLPANADINWPGLTTIGVGVATILIGVFGIGLLVRPRRTSLAEAGKASGVAGIGLGWLAFALTMFVGVLIAAIGSFTGFIFR